MKKFLILFATFVFMISIGYAHEEAKIPSEYKNLVNPVQPTEDAIAAGSKLFEQNCVACHGADGKGALSGMPDLTDHKMMSEMGDGGVFYKISEGVEGTGMPAWKDRLTKDERWELVNYINTLHQGQGKETPHETTPPATSAPAPQKKGVCGPTALLLIGTLPLLAGRHFFNKKRA